MQTKLSAFCDRVIEAGWLTAAIVTPLFFNWYSDRVFEASKVALLRSITLVMLAAWLIRLLETGLPREKQNGKMSLALLRTPLIVPVLLFAGVYLLSTVTSVAPRISFWGSYHRRQGLYVVLCYIAIFFLTLKTLRARQQLERLLAVILLTSLPVSLYGIMQHYGVDPLVWITGGAYRVESSLGNPILIGAYLIMVIPLTVWQLIRSLSLTRTKEKQAGPFVALGCYLIVLLLQLLCLVFTQSRGPLMGLMVGGLFFFLLLAALRRQRGMALAVLGVSVALLATLAILNLPNSPLTPLKEIPYISRLTNISNISGRSPIWQSAVDMITADRSRAIIGYGPESMGLIFYQYVHPDWAAIAGSTLAADRSHNETLDAAVTGGLIGLLAYLALFGSIFYYGLKWLGLIVDSRQRDFLIATWLVGGSLGVLIPGLVEGSLKWAGVGIPAGILLALVIYLLTTLLHQSPKPRVQSPTSDSQILLVALLSALIAHFVEIQFGIAITATRTYFWLYAALVVIVGYYWQRHPEPARWVEGEEPIPETVAETSSPDSSRQRRDRRRRRRSKPPTLRPRSGWASNFKLPDSGLLTHSLLMGLVLATIGFDLITHQFDLRANGPVVFGLLFAIWLLGGILTLVSNLQSQISNLSTYILSSLFCFLPFLAVHAAIILPGAGVERATAVYYAYLFSVIFVVAVALMTGSNPRLPVYRFRAWWLYPIIGVGVFLLVFNSNLKVAQADIYYKFGLSSEETGEVDKAIALYHHAIKLAPHWDRYYASLGLAYAQKAATASDVNQRVALFEESSKALEHAKQMSPLDPDIMAMLGHVHWDWGALTSDPEQRAVQWEAAMAHYQRAVTLSPLNHGQLLKGNVAQTYLRLGETYAAIGKLDQAVEAYREANEIAPDSYEGRKGLTSAYLQLGRLDEALEEAKAARDLAPEEEKSALDDLIAQLEAQRE
jgi:tetratricopeptide (TPR) repeat protein/O-antigen ligase